MIRQGQGIGLVFPLARDGGWKTPPVGPWPPSGNACDVRLIPKNAPGWSNLPPCPSARPLGTAGERCWPPALAALHLPSLLRGQQSEFSPSGCASQWLGARALLSAGPRAKSQLFLNSGAFRQVLRVVLANTALRTSTPDLLKQPLWCGFGHFQSG